jgi:LysM repeat protein
MEKTPTDISTGESLSSTTTTEERTLRDVVYGSKRAGGNYGSLSKSQTQPTFHISHKVESNDTLQRLALKYSIHVCILFYFFPVFNDDSILIKDSRN